MKAVVKIWTLASLFSFHVECSMDAGGRLQALGDADRWEKCHGRN